MFDFESHDGKSLTRIFDRCRKAGDFLPDILKPTKEKVFLTGLSGILSFALALCGHGTATFFFPTGEEYLRRKGYPNQAKNLTDKTVYVRDRRTTAGYIHSYFDFLHNPKLFELQGRDSLRADFIGNESGSHGMISLPAAEVTLGKTLVDIVKFPDGIIENDPLSAEETALFIVFHELAHSAGKNRNLPPPINEADSDIRSVLEMEKIFDKDGIRTAVTHWRAVSFESTHDNVLYLDAYFNGKPLPTEKEITEATIFLNALIVGMQRTETSAEEDKRLSFYKNRTYACYAVATRNDLPVPPLTRRRAALFIEAMQYFAPGFTKKIIEDFERNAPKQPGLLPPAPAV